MAITVVTQNKKAYHDYFVVETVEAGMVLSGVEVKSLRAGRVNLKDSYARIKGEEVYLVNTHISPYERADGFAQTEPDRTRKLLLHKEEITRLIGKTRVKGYTIIPTRIYFKAGKAKVELALAKGKTFHDKREAIKKKDVEREMSKAMSARRGGKREKAG
ncbi:MAG: SsrA-binding protein SmpB [Deltaproteobacteria bacterium]|nr:SsrA-binding protein SmpB [Deltaproteobacteria bacterium]